jgi:hypothetical protein
MVSHYDKFIPAQFRDEVADPAGRRREFAAAPLAGRDDPMRQDRHAEYRPITYCA